MTAAEVKKALYARHHASGDQMPGAWTCIEEWRNIDLLAFSAWASRSGGSFDRIGYEVKVSRSDLRHELLNPSKRAANVEWCNAFYLAVPKGLLTPEEIAYEQPEWEPQDFMRPACTRVDPDRIHGLWRRSGRSGSCRELVPIPAVKTYEYQRFDKHSSAFWTRVPCRTCGGSGFMGKSKVELEGPTVWVPPDVGLIVVDGNGTKLVKKAPRRKDVPALTPSSLGQLVRFVSMRPDPRHLAKARTAHLLETVAV